MTGSRSRYYSSGQAVWDSLKVIELSLRKAKVERVTVVTCTREVATILAVE
jgi:hypothetical protein